MSLRGFAEAIEEACNLGKRFYDSVSEPTAEAENRRKSRTGPGFSRGLTHRLNTEQKGSCAGSRRASPRDPLELDHVVPRSRSGPDDDRNAQLLCATSNRTKGPRSRKYLLRKLGRIP